MNSLRRTLMLLFFAATCLFSFAEAAERECIFNSDCKRGMICNSAGRCGAECRTDVDCPTQGAAFQCVNTITLKNTTIPASIGGGEFAFHCLPRATELPQSTALPKIHPELANFEYVGVDFWSFTNFSGDAQICAQECAKNRETCRAWVMMNPGRHGPFARCYLRSSIEQLIQNGDTVTGALL